MFWCSYPRKAGDWTHVISIDEFGANHNDDCGPCANENLQACLQGIPPTYAHMDAIRTYDLQNRHFTAGGGQAIGDINWDVHNWSLLDHTVLQDYIAHHVYSLTDIRAACEQVGTTYTPQGGVVVEVSNAQLLPFNEQGVFNHFVTIVGYDSDADSVHPHILVCNGDRTPLPKGTGKPDWYPLDALEAAQPIGILQVYIKGAPQPPLIPPDDSAILAEVTAIEQAAHDILTHAGNIRTLESVTP